MKWALFPVAVIATAFFAWGQAAVADSGARVDKYIRIPVFYVTDRNRRDKSKGDQNVDFGGERKYRGACSHELSLGVAYCSIRNTENKEFKSCMGAMGWQKAGHDGEGPEGINLTPGADYPQIKKAFYESLYKDTVSTSDREMMIFIPGYMSTFESGLRSAARLGYYSERPVMLYSWASKGKFTQYFADEATIEWTQDHFNDTLTSLGELSERNPPIHARLYSHSMGGRLVLRATPMLRSSKVLREVSVICPDVDDGVVKHYAAKYFDGRGDLLVRLYISKRDYMLRMSQFVHGGYGRLGEDRQPLDSLLPKDTSKLVPDSMANSQEHPCPESLHRKLLTIDFTAVDIGTLGHRIPVELITGLSQTGDPGGRLKLCIVTPKGQIISEDQPANDDNDGIVKVLKPGWRGTPIMGTIVRYRPRIRLLMTKDWSLK